MKKKRGRKTNGKQGKSSTTGLCPDLPYERRLKQVLKRASNWGGGEGARGGEEGGKEKERGEELS